jgi:hypothetical protein
MQAYAIGKHTDSGGCKGADTTAVIAAVADETTIARICGMLSQGKSQKEIYTLTGHARFWPQVARDSAHPQ